MEKLNQNLKIAKEILEREARALNPNEMYFVAQKYGLESKLTFNGKTPEASFAALIYMDVKNNPDSIFEVTQTKPKKLIKLKSQTENFKFENKTSEDNSNLKTHKSPFHERDLHPLLVSYAYSSDNFHAYAKTIFHESSQKSQKGADKWLYPDIVGVSFEYAELDFNDKVINFINKFDKLPIKIFAFEMKKELTVANFREYYFQAVSNSSFANEGYLVAAQIDRADEELMDLIKRLNSSFGIGVIHLNIENPSQSEILARARYRENLDYTVIAELSRKNKDFSGFLKTIADFDAEESHRFLNEFDAIMNEEELEKYKIEKKISNQPAIPQ